MVPECKPEWNREAITVFSRLPSLRRLQATPLLQTSLVLLDTFAEINQNLLKIYFIHILLNFMYLVTLYQKTVVNKSNSTHHPSQLINVTDI